MQFQLCWKFYTSIEIWWAVINSIYFYGQSWFWRTVRKYDTWCVFSFELIFLIFPLLFILFFFFFIFFFFTFFFFLFLVTLSFIKFFLTLCRSYGCCSQHALKVLILFFLFFLWTFTLFTFILFGKFSFFFFLFP